MIFVFFLLCQRSFLAICLFYLSPHIVETLLHTHGNNTDKQREHHEGSDDDEGNEVKPRENDVVLGAVALVEIRQIGVLISWSKINGQVNISIELFAAIHVYVHVLSPVF